jgi:1-phosphofructokinase
MIYTVTLNPSIDCIYRLDCFLEGKVNRANFSDYVAGGKGINVSKVLTNLGVRSIATGFAAGFTGEKICSEIVRYGIETDFVNIPRETSRINIKLKQGTETEINAEGPDVPQICKKELFRRLSSLKDGDWLVLSGSVPQSAGADFYGDIIETMNLSGSDIKIVVDCSGEALKNVLHHRVFMIKPNLSELEELFGCSISPDEAIPYAEKLQKECAEIVIVSMAENGAVMACPEGVFTVEAAEGEVVNSTGAGDSMVAAFIAEYVSSEDVREAFLLGNAAGAAKAFSEDFPDRDRIYAIREGMNITKIR